jgi:hypothetical protein
VIFITVFTLTSVPLVTDSFADERDRRRSNDNRIEQTQGKRVERARSRSSDNRFKRVQEKRGEKSLYKKRWENKKRIISPRSMRHGHKVRKLPRGYKRAWYKRTPYYYRFGVFYRPGTSGYIVVKAPIGAIVVSLPVGNQRLWVDGSAYYVYGGIFYKRVPKGFVIVQPPDTVVVDEIDPDIVQPSQTATGEVSVTAPVLNVRSGPTLGDPKIYQIHEGYILEIHGKSNGWLYVQLPNGEFGWVKSIFTRPLEPASG